MRTLTFLVVVLAALGLAGQQLPHPDHIVVVIEENKDFEDIIGSPNAPYLNSLLPDAALLKKSYGLHHPSQPNYLELFSGNQQGVCNDSCPSSINAPNLAASLKAAHKSSDPIPPFIGYAEHFDPACSSKPTVQWYAQKHCPWRDFPSLPASMSADFNAFPTNFDTLPHVAFVIPDLTHDMHNLPNGLFDTAKEVLAGDTWLKQKLDKYREYALSHNSLLIITWDEDNALPVHVGDDCEHAVTTLPPHNQIATIILGKHVIRGSTSATAVTHYNILRTIEDMEGLPPIGASCGVPPITGIWK